MDGIGKMCPPMGKINAPLYIGRTGENCFAQGILLPISLMVGFTFISEKNVYHTYMMNCFCRIQCDYV